MTLDEWSDEEVDSMIEIGGNASANSIYEAFLPDTCSKPGPDVNHDQRMRFIRSDSKTKYSVTGQIYCCCLYSDLLKIFI